MLAALVFLTPATAAITRQDARLLHRDYQLYQAWALSRNYFFGTTVNQDAVNALSWQIVYVNLLPASYPQKESLLTFFKKNLNKAQITQAESEATRLIAHYQLEPLSEKALQQVYQLREKDIKWTSLGMNVPSQVNVNDWFNWLHSKPYAVATLESKGKQTGVIGRVSPWRGIEQGNIILQRTTSTNSPMNLFLRPIIPLTINSDGLFYTTGLAAGAYELVINADRFSTKVKFAVKAGEIKGLSIIHLS